MKYLITGTKGFIGKNLKEELRSGEIVEINEDIFDNPNWFESLENFLIKEKPEAIFHVGACSDTLERDVNYMMTRNYESTKIISDWSRNNLVPLVYSSSAACYGTNARYPSNLYGWSKYVAEDYVIKNGGIALRYFNVYGPGEVHKGKMSSVALQAWYRSSSADHNTEPPVFQKSRTFKIFPKKPTRDFVYVKDIISANLFALKNFSTLHSKWYEVGSGDSRPFEDILDLMKIRYEYTSEDLIPTGYQFFTCSDKGRWMSGWNPNFNLEKGICDYLEFLNNSRNS